VLTALYCRGFVLPALSSLPCPPALSSQPCAHGLVLTVLCSRLVLTVLAHGLILQILFFRHYLLALHWHRADLALMLPLALHGLTCSDIAGCGLAQVDRFSWIARLFCRRLGTYADCDRARTLGFRGLLLCL